MAYVVKTKKRVYYKNEQIINTSTPGVYEFTPTEDILCYIRIVGAGAGGAFNSSPNRSSCAAGGSGSGCGVLATLKKGVTYNLYVGMGGAPAGGVDATATGGRAQASALRIGEVNILTAEGGIGGNVWYPNGQSQGAPAPFPYSNMENENFIFKKWVFRSRGIPGGIGGNPSEGGQSVIPDEYAGIMGKGGNAWNAGSSSRAVAGNAGYVQLIYKHIVPAGSDYDDYEDIGTINLVKRKKRTYYKYVYENWVQPVLTSNTGNPDFQVSATSQYNESYAPWKSFTNAVNEFAWMTAVVPSESSPQVFQFYSPRPLKISSITMRNRTADNPGSFSKFKIRASDDGINWVDLTNIITNNQNTNNYGWSLNIPSGRRKPYRYHAFVITAANGSPGRCSLGFPKISAEVVTATTEATENDYDIYTDVEQNYCIKRKRRHYYKYVSRGSWNQPVLTSNTSAAPDMDLSKTTGFMTHFSSLWQAFRKISDGSAYVTVNAGSAAWTSIFITFDKPKRVKSVYAYGPVIGNVSSSITGLRVYTVDRFLNRIETGYAEGVNAIQVAPDSNIIGKEIIVQVRTNGDGDRFPSRLREILMDLETYDIKEVSAGEPYDYYIDEDI